MSNDDLQRCLEHRVKEGKATKMQALVVLSHTRHWPAAKRRWNALIKSRTKDAGDELIRLAVEVCSTPEDLRDSLFTAEELEAE